MPTYAANGGPWSNSGSALLTLAVVPVAVGDILVFAFQAASTSLSSSVSGGGVTTWTRASGHEDTNDQQLVEIWWGPVTATGSATITVTNSGATGFNRVYAREFSSTPSGTWSVVAASPSPATSSASSSGTGTAVSYPSLTGSGLYIGNADSVFGSMSGGSTSGFTYDNNNGHQEYAWNVAAVNAAPTSVQTNTGDYEICAALFQTTSGANPAGSEQPRATVPVPRRVPARGQSRGQGGAAYVAVAAPRQEYRTLPRRVPARGVSHGQGGQAYVAVPAPRQEPYLPPRRKPGRAVIGFTPVTTTNAVPAVSGPPLQAGPVPRRAPARGVSHGIAGQAYVAVPAPPQSPPGPRRRGPRRAISRGQGGQAYAAVPAPRQPPYLPPRRRPARAWVQFTPVTTTNTPVAFVAVPAPRQMATWPRRRPARAVIGFTPVTTTNAPPHHRPPGGTPSSEGAREWKRWLLWGP